MKRLYDISGLEREDIEELKIKLLERRINVYETPRGNWGGSMAALWVSNDAQYAQARVIVKEFIERKYGKSVKSHDNSIVSNAMCLVSSKLKRFEKQITFIVVILLILFFFVLLY